VGEAHLGSFSFVFFFSKVAYSFDSGFQVISITLLAPTNLPKEGFWGILFFFHFFFFSLPVFWIGLAGKNGRVKKKRQ